jgi:hypothetical protein
MIRPGSRAGVRAGPFPLGSLWAALLALAAVLVAVLIAGLGFSPAIAANTPSPDPGPGPGTLILSPGQITVSRSGRADVSIPAPPLVELTVLARLVHDAGLIVQRPDGVVELRATIVQRAGSRLSISDAAVPQLRFLGGAHLAGAGALLSVNGVLLVAAGDVTGPATGLLSYSSDSAIRMSRVRIQDQRTGPGAGPVLMVDGGARVRLTSVLITGGQGVSVDDAHPAELTGVQIEASRTDGLSVLGSTQLRLRDVGVRGSAGAGLMLRGGGVRVRTAGWISSTGNGAEAVRLDRTRDVSLDDLRLSTKDGPALNVPRASAEPASAALSPAGQQDGAAAGSADGAHLPLVWVFLAGVLVLAAASGLEHYQIRTR